MRPAKFARVSYELRLHHTRGVLVPDGFRDIIERWRATGETDNADQAERALATFARSYPQAHDNLASDAQVRPTIRRELLKQLLLVDSSNADVVNGKVLGFCRSHQCAGSRNSTAEQSRLGHVETRAMTQGTLSSTHSATSGVTRRRRGVSLLIDDLLRRDLAGQKSVLGNSLLSRWLMWSFYQPRIGQEPFRNVAKTRPELIRRLGLGLTSSGEELLVWEHVLQPPQTAHRPTALDADAYEYFRPGGKTRPLSGSDGLHEVVHRPIRADQLAARIESVP